MPFTLPLHLSIYLSVCLSVCLSVYLSIHPSIYLYLSPSLSLSCSFALYVPVNTTTCMVQKRHSMAEGVPSCPVSPNFGPKRASYANDGSGETLSPFVLFGARKSVVSYLCHAYCNLDVIRTVVSAIFRSCSLLYLPSAVLQCTSVF